MPSPHSRGKSRRNRKGKAPLRQRTETAPAAEQPAAVNNVTTTPPPAAIPRPAATRRPAGGARATAAAKGAPRQYAIPEYPYVSGELIRIGILAVILVVLLIVLSQILT